MIRVVLVIIVAIVIISIFKILYSLMPIRKCPECHGHGYWIGTRGDKNTCKLCQGSGKRP
jgi:DnaJ-class molecular chaperone